MCVWDVSNINLMPGWAKQWTNSQVFSCLSYCQWNQLLFYSVPLGSANKIYWLKFCQGPITFCLGDIEIPNFGLGDHEHRTKYWLLFFFFSLSGQTIPMHNAVGGAMPGPHQLGTTRMPNHDTSVVIQQAMPSPQSSSVITQAPSTNRQIG